MKAFVSPKRRSRLARRTGFTLLELMIVLAIIGVIAAMVLPRLLGQQQTANIKACKGSIRGLEQSVDLYAVENSGEYPQGNQDALNMLLQPQGKTKALLDKLPVDPWGKPFYYEYPNTKAKQSDRPAIWSSGPDGKNDNGANDDVNNWEQEVKS